MSIAALAGETWSYTHYTSSGRPLDSGKLQLFEEGGNSWIEMFSYHEYADPCYAKKKMNVTVAREADSIVITTKDLMRGCAPLRLVIRADGTGGRQEVQAGEAWVPDNRDHGFIRK
jgi:hypothetical protein